MEVSRYIIVKEIKVWDWNKSQSNSDAVLTSELTSEDISESEGESSSNGDFASEGESDEDFEDESNSDPNSDDDPKFGGNHISEGGHASEGGSTFEVQHLILYQYLKKILNKFRAHKESLIYTY